MSIEGLVARIVDESALIINRGAEHGVRAGMRFAVFAEVEDVADPETGEPLGKWELVKGLVAAAHVQERMSVCGPLPAEAVGRDDTHTLSYEMVAVSMSLGKGEGRLDVDRSQASGRPKAGPIKVGDRVRSVE
ncbi:MAG: hypothetical protein ACYTGB_01490 [Planctomycetota bacterium]|jgi:hypothetical protein